MLYLHVSLSRSRLCHAFCPLWACACLVASIPPRDCLDVTTCAIHLRGVGVLDSHLSLLCVMLIWLPCLLCATRLAFFASLHACLHVHAWVCVSSILQFDGTMDTWYKPTFVLLGHPLFFDIMFVCPHLVSFPSLSLACFSFHLFLCLSTSLFLLSLHVHAWSTGT